MAKLGYARATEQKSLDIQIAVLKESGCEKVYTDITLGEKNRIQLAELIDSLSEGDTVLALAADRYSRTVQGLIYIIDQISEKGCTLETLDEGEISTPDYKLLIQITEALNRYSINKLRNRQARGIAVTKARGVRFRRPPKKHHKGVIDEK